MVLLEPPQRLWALEGCCNFRDLGGHATATGATLRARRLFRSDCLSAASDADRRELAGLRLATVIDLRSRSEVDLAGASTRHAPAHHHHLPFGDPLDGMAARDWNDPEKVAARYVELLLSGTETVAEVLAVLTDPAAYPAVVHCSVGKDRTGIVVALILALLRVGDDDIVSDYALSGMGAARLALRLREHFAARPSDIEPYLPALLSAQPESMRAFLELLRTKFGSAEGYVEDIGLGSAIGYLRTALLDP